MTRFAIIRNDSDVLSQPVPNGPFQWLDYGLTLATDWRYAVLFETRSGAEKSAYMNGAAVHVVGEFDSARCA